MKLTFLGADHEVTGSCHFLQAAGLNILVDCGMEQGNDVYENQENSGAASGARRAFVAFQRVCRHAAGRTGREHRKRCPMVL